MEKKRKNPTKLQILNLLVQPYTFSILKEMEEKPVRFSELVSKRITTPKTMSDKLRRLREYGLIDYVSIESKSGKYANAYQISDFGRRVLKELKGIGII
jgi:DNA-binding HxlR family transcriptional regulator